MPLSGPTDDDASITLGMLTRPEQIVAEAKCQDKRKYCQKVPINPPGLLSFQCPQSCAARLTEMIPEVREEAILATPGTVSQGSPHLCAGELSLYRLQVLVNQADGNCTLTYSRSHPPHRSLANITGGKDAWHTGLQQIRVALELPVLGAMAVLG